MTELKTYDFIADLQERILQYASTPKLQVERVVGPILTIFIEDLINELLNPMSEPDRRIHLVGPEWPLKKLENDQSTNVDWLMVQPGTNTVFLIELKTDANSRNSEQLDRYRAIQTRVKVDSAGFLFNNVRTIRDASSESWKYDFVLEKAKELEKEVVQCPEAKIVYIVPQTLKSGLLEQGVLPYSFEDLPERIKSERNEAWARIRPILLALEHTERNSRSLSSRRESQTRSEFASTISMRLKRQFPTKRATRVWFGRTGDGSLPNYQVQFEDGTVQPFYNSGKPYLSADRFKESNLDGPFVLEELLR